MINKVILVGRVGADPQFRALDNGNAVARISLATSERYTDKSGAKKELPEWHNVVVWNRQAEIADKYVRKGSQLYIEGKIRTRKWTNAQNIECYTTEIWVSDMKLLGSRGDAAQPAATSATAQEKSAAAPLPLLDHIDDLPF